MDGAIRGDFPHGVYQQNLVEGTPSMVGLWVVFYVFLICQELVLLMISKLSLECLGEVRSVPLNIGISVSRGKLIPAMRHGMGMSLLRVILSLQVMKNRRYILVSTIVTG